MADFKISGMTLKAFLDVLETRDLRGAVVARLSPEGQEVCASPMGRRWHPGAIGEELWGAILQQGGPTLYEDVSYEMTRRSFGPVVGPLLKVALALTGTSPAAVFSRMNQLSSLALQDVRFDWEAKDATSGVVTVSYPRSLPLEVIEPGWRGIFRMGAELVGTPCRVEQCVPQQERNGFAFHVAW